MIKKESTEGMQVRNRAWKWHYIVWAAALMITAFAWTGTCEARAKHVFDIGPELSYIQYKEPDIMDEKGPSIGVSGSYTYHDKIMARVAGRFSYSRVDYDSQDTGSISGINDYGYEVRGLLGYDFTPSKTFTISPFVGFGYRYLCDDVSGKTTTTGHMGYKRESNYFYSPIGIEAAKKISKKWSCGASAEYDFFWTGKQTSYLGNVVKGLDKLENDQKGGYGWRASLYVAMATRRATYALEPFVRYWNIDKSDAKGITYRRYQTGWVGWEPENNSTEYGLKIKLIFD
ncbi:MAG TPA: outer membrane beta-barrel protein [Syntrophorhabdaceae bacterium]|nr:outer membrane beta-barrel protein [Syntrophorhabdaceae bacterium]